MTGTNGKSGAPQNSVPNFCLKLLKGCPRDFFNLAHSDVRSEKKGIRKIFIESFSADRLIL